MNDTKPIWLRKPKEVSDEDYSNFYKSFSKVSLSSIHSYCYFFLRIVCMYLTGFHTSFQDSDDPLAKVHFVAEGEVTFRSILFVPKTSPGAMFNDYGKRTDHIKLYVRRVFITDDFQEMMPKYLGFVKGVVDSDDLPLNVSRETLQQHKLLKVIRKKLVRKVLDMFKKISKEDYIEKFWKEYSTK